MPLGIALGWRSTRTTFPKMQRSLSLLLTYGNCPYTETFIHNAFGACIWRLALLIGKGQSQSMLGSRLVRGHLYLPTHAFKLQLPEGRAEEEGGFSCRKSVLALGPTTASRAGAAQLQRDPGLWGPDRGRHGNGGSVVPGTGRGRVHIRSPGFRFGADKLPPAADDPGRAQVLGIRVRNGG